MTDSRPAARQGSLAQGVGDEARAAATTGYGRIKPSHRPDRALCTIPPMYLVLIAATGTASLVLAVYAWGQRRHPGFAHFALTELAIGWWTLCYLGEHLDPAHDVAWFTAKFPAVGAIPSSWLVFALYQSGRRPRHWWLFYLWPVLLGPIMISNEWHQLMFTGFTRGHELVGTAGPLFAVHLALSYGLFAIAEAVLIRDWWQRRNLQTGLLAAGGLLPFAGSLAYQLAVSVPAIGRHLAYDTTLPGFGLAALFTGWAATRHRLLDPGPVARDALFAWLPDVVFVLNEREEMADLNQAALEMVGRPEAEVLGHRWREVFPTAPWCDPPFGEAGLRERAWTRAGVTVWYELRTRPLRGSHGEALGTMIVGRDVTARREVEEQLRHESRRDGLTGLSNRRHFDDEAARLRASREFPVAVFAFDLDDLKRVNDAHGHAAGDELLRSTAQFLKQFFRAGDRVFRLGGDEFLVLLPTTSAAEAERIRQRMDDALRRHNECAAHALRFSTGVAVAEDPASWDASLALADQRLYDAKSARTIPARNGRAQRGGGPATGT